MVLTQFYWIIPLNIHTLVYLIWHLFKHGIWCKQMCHYTFIQQCQSGQHCTSLHDEGPLLDRLGLPIRQDLISTKVFVIICYWYLYSSCYMSRLVGTVKVVFPPEKCHFAHWPSPRAHLSEHTYPSGSNGRKMDLSRLLIAISDQHNPRRSPWSNHLIDYLYNQCQIQLCY